MEYTTDRLFLHDVKEGDWDLTVVIVGMYVDGTCIDDIDAVDVSLGVHICGDSIVDVVVKYCFDVFWWCFGKISPRRVPWFSTGRCCHHAWILFWRHVCHGWWVSVCSRWKERCVCYCWKCGGSCWCACACGIGLERDDGYSRIKTLHTYRGVLCKMYTV